jgi:hypothetical protein
MLNYQNMHLNFTNNRVGLLVSKITMQRHAA